MRLSFRYLFSLILLILSCVSMHGQDKFREVVDKVWKNSKYQKELLSEQKTENSFSEKDFQFDPSFYIPETRGRGGESLWKMIVYGLAIAMGIALLVYLFQYWNGLKKALPEDTAPGQKEKKKESKEATPLLEEPEELYRRGLYLQACRAILRKVLQKLVAKNYLPDKPYLTNIELVQSLSQENLKLCLKGLSKTIERGYYAGETLTQEDYQQCQELWKKMTEYLSARLK